MSDIENAYRMPFSTAVVGVVVAGALEGALARVSIFSGSLVRTPSGCEGLLKLCCTALSQ